VKFTLTRGKPPGIDLLLAFGFCSLAFSMGIASLRSLNMWPWHHPHITIHVLSKVFVPCVLLLVSGCSFRGDGLHKSWVDFQPDVVFHKRGFRAMLMQSNLTFANTVAHLVIGSKYAKVSKEHLEGKMKEVCDPRTFEGFVEHLNQPLLHSKRPSIQ